MSLGAVEEADVESVKAFALMYFGYFDLFSDAPQGTIGLDYAIESMVAQSPDLVDMGLFIGFGAFVVAFDDCWSLQSALDGLRIPYVSRAVPYGPHYKNTWQHTLWHFARLVLWKGKSITRQSGHGVE
ncbi:carbohydrate esterase family 1 protein [Penicillium riverlandense]|uniref:carbohydrate esterase family 1 protein n=1 Tax=Penicillium riverlandense TaxID=1903569 RepID=UPI002547915E|nr:carbohydrate esterase family 1 protein [Penicillium riverlandense]KAJ5814944.1 carbohydrate esterase family 1 protein [Penicillium riverlandense]